jgi:hypothetical protein
MNRLPEVDGLSRRRSRFGAIACCVVLLALVVPADAHRSGCHRWHSCPTDHDTYVCGDLGYCSQCPDNRYCLARKPRAATTKPEDREPSEKLDAPKRESPRGPDSR